jgi:hypothetical protein
MARSLFFHPAVQVSRRPFEARRAPRCNPYATCANLVSHTAALRAALSRSAQGALAVTFVIGAIVIGVADYFGWPLERVSRRQSLHLGEWAGTSGFVR